MQKLKEDEIQTHLNDLEDWTINENLLSKDFGFKGFSTAIKFINMLVPIADKLNHYPVISNSYNRVTITLTTHSAKGLTKCDFLFAKRADEVADKLRK